MDLEGNFCGAMHVCPIPVTSVEEGSFCKLRTRQSFGRCSELLFHSISTLGGLLKKVLIKRTEADP